VDRDVLHDHRQGAPASERCEQADACAAWQSTFDSIATGRIVGTGAASRIPIAPWARLRQAAYGTARDAWLDLFPSEFAESPLHVMLKNRQRQCWSGVLRQVPAHHVRPDPDEGGEITGCVEIATDLTIGTPTGDVRHSQKLEVSVCWPAAWRTFQQSADRHPGNASLALEAAPAPFRLPANVVQASERAADLAPSCQLRGQGQCVICTTDVPGLVRNSFR